MIELLLVLGLIGVLLGGALLFTLVSWEVLLVVGTGLVALGLLVGVPGGLGYHLRLYRALAPTGRLPRRWWLRPTEAHPRLEGRERRQVLAWFAVGGAGFVLIMLGCLLAAVGALRGR